MVVHTRLRTTLQGGTLFDLQGVPSDGGVSFVPAVGHPKAFTMNGAPLLSRSWTCDFFQMDSRGQAGRLRESIGILLPRVSGTAGRLLCKGIRSVLSAAGFSGVVLGSSDQPATWSSLRGVIGVSGLLTSGAMCEGLEGVPSVSFADPQSPMSGADISVDRETLLRLALQHLAAYGHRRIAVVYTQDTDLDSAQGSRELHSAERAAGLRDLGRVCVPAPGLEGPRENAKAIHNLLFGGDVTALLCSSDQLARGAMDAAQALGRKCPLDLSVMGCGGTGGDGPATTLQIPWAAMGSIAAHQLLLKLRKPWLSTAGSILVQPRVVPGGSTAAAA